MINRNLVAATCLLALAACSREASAPPPPGPASGAAAPAAPTKTTAAVREGSGNAAVRLRFLIDKPPVVGQEMQLQLDFSSYISGPVTLDVNFEGDQLNLQPGAETTSISLPQSGVDVSHTLVLVPQAAGLSELKVHAKIAGEEGGAQATYVIPILADSKAAKAP